MMEQKVTPDLIYGFVNTLLAPHLDNPKPTPSFHLKLWNLCCLPDEFVAVSAPRGHAKSTAVTVAYTLCKILFRESRFVVIASATEALAVEHLRDIKKIVGENEELKALFGISRILKDNETDFIVEFTDRKKFRIIAKGSEQRIRGLKWEGIRPDLIIGDDLEDDEQVENQDRREKFRHWFFSALVPCKGQYGIVRVVGTIMHFDSLLERLLRSKDWQSARFKAHNEDFSFILWPELWSKEKLQRTRQMYVDMGMPEKYSQEYLNVPLDDSVAYFRKTDFSPMEEYDHSKPKDYYIAGDLAISHEDRAAFTAFVVASVDQNGELDVEHVVRARLDGLQIIETMFALNQRYKPELFILEQEKIAKSLGPFLNQEMVKRGSYINIYPVTPTKDKEHRARGIQARMRAGGVKFDMEASWFPDLYEEMLQFPKGPFADQVDSLAWIGLVLDKINEAKSKEEIEQEEYDEEYDEHMTDFSGISNVTGY